MSKKPSGWILFPYDYGSWDVNLSLQPYSGITVSGLEDIANFLKETEAID